MRLTLTDDDGVVLETWYVPDEETPRKELERLVDNTLPVYQDREEYLSIVDS